MAKVLLLDTDKTQSSELKKALETAGHEVQGSRNGRGAVELALRWRPDFLVTESLLDDRPNGLDVAGCLRSVRPELHGILLTGFPSEDLRQHAIDDGLLGYFTKPANIDKLCEAISKGAEIAPRPVQQSIAFLEYEDSKQLVYASPEARRLFDLPEELGEESRLSRLLDRKSLTAIEEHRFEWVPVQTTGSDSRSFEAFPMFTGVGNRCLLVLPEGPEERKNSPEVRLIVESMRLSLRSQAFKKPKPRVLVIDADRLQRRLTSQQIENLGMQFHSAESLERGTQLLEADERVGIILIDYGTDGAGVLDIVREIHDLRPEVKVVGTSLAFRKREFQELGADGFLAKPVNQESLRKILGV